MLVGSLNWNQQWYGSSTWSPEMAAAAAVAAGLLPSHASAAATAAYAGHMGAAAPGFDWGGLGQALEEQDEDWQLGQTMEGHHSAVMPWPAELAAQQQQQQPRARSMSSTRRTGERKDSDTEAA
jgi:hypothetical protein